MADNVPINTGSGASVATDDISGSHFQRVKLIHGQDGVNSGDTYSGNPFPVRLYSGIDAATNAITTVDYAHHEAHAGDAYVAFRTEVNIGAANSKYVAFVTPNTTKWAHMDASILSTGECLAQMYEDSVLADNGTAITAYNRNRNSANTAAVTVFHTPSITSAGTVILETILGSGRSGGSARAEEEFILKQNTKYMIKVTSNAAGCDWTVRLAWYEHTSIA